MSGNTSAPYTVGPMGPSVSNLTILIQAILSRQPWLHDPKLVELPWRADHHDEVVNCARSGGLVFGILSSDGVMTPQPPVLRALKEVKARIEAAGHEVPTTGNFCSAGYALIVIRLFNGTLPLTLNWRTSQYVLRI